MASYTYTPVPDTGAKAGVLAYLVVSAVVLLLMMVFGLLMRLEQSQFTSMGGLWFYKIMTLHGAGMVGIVALAGAAVMWHFLRLYVDLSNGIFMANLALFLIGVVIAYVLGVQAQRYGANLFVDGGVSAMDLS